MREFGRRRSGSSWLAGLAVLGLTASTMLAGTANAAPITLGTAGVYAIVGQGPSGQDADVQKSAIVNGNVFARNKIGVNSGGKINGKLFKVSTTSVSTSGGTITGGQVVLTTTQANQIATDVNNAKSAINALTATNNTYANTKITNSVTITGVAGQNVVKIKSIDLADAKTITFTGPANATFIVKVTDDVKLQKTAKIIAANGPQNLLIAFGGNFSQQNGSGTGPASDGTYLALANNGVIDLKAGVHNGAFIGNDIDVSSNGTKLNFVGFVPEPGVLSLLSLGLGGLGLMGRKRPVCQGCAPCDSVTIS